MATKKARWPKEARTALRAAREADGFTRAQLAVALGVDPSTLMRWEEGISRPSPLALVALRARFPDAGL